MFVLENILIKLLLYKTFIFVAVLDKTFVNTDENDRIINGVPVYSNKRFPYVVAIEIKVNEFEFYQFCGGSIISKKFILTAAHCLSEPEITKYRIRCGTVYRQRGGRLYEVKKLIQHPKFDPVEFSSDIGLIQIRGTIEFSKIVNKIKLPDHKTKLPAVGLVLGWGSTQVAYYSEILLLAHLPIISPTICSSFYPDRNLSGTICAGFVEGGVDTCSGDSGGGLVIHKSIYGVVSWGEGCAQPNKPGVYTRVLKFITFIKRYVKW